MNRPELTAERFLPDSVCWGGQGGPHRIKHRGPGAIPARRQHRVPGRIDEQVKIRGLSDRARARSRRCWPSIRRSGRRGGERPRRPPREKRLVAYMVPAEATGAESETLRIPARASARLHASRGVRNTVKLCRSRPMARSTAGVAGAAVWSRGGSPPARYSAQLARGGRGRDLVRSVQPGAGRCARRFLRGRGATRSKQRKSSPGCETGSGAKCLLRHMFEDFPTIAELAEDVARTLQGGIK